MLVRTKCIELEIANFLFLRAPLLGAVCIAGGKLVRAR